MGKRIIIYKITETGCWECISHACDHWGYPRAYRNGKVKRVFRYFYEIHKGDIHKGDVIRHTCDNRKCINPEHLILGTHQDNVRDRVLRNRSAIGEKNGRSKLMEGQVKQIILDDITPKRELARIFGVDPKAIRSIKQRKIWRSVKV